MGKLFKRKPSFRTPLQQKLDKIIKDQFSLNTEIIFFPLGECPDFLRDEYQLFSIEKNIVKTQVENSEILNA